MGMEDSGLYDTRYNFYPLCVRYNGLVKGLNQYTVELIVGTLSNVCNSRSSTIGGAVISGNSVIFIGGVRCITIVIAVVFGEELITLSFSILNAF